MTLIDIVVFDGVDEMDALGTLEVLRSAAAGLTTRLVTREEADTVHGAFGLRFSPDGVYRPGEADIVVMPGEVGLPE